MTIAGSELFPFVSLTIHMKEPIHEQTEQIMIETVLSKFPFHIRRWKRAGEPPLILLASMKPSQKLLIYGSQIQIWSAWAETQPDGYLLYCNQQQTQLWVFRKGIVSNEELEAWTKERQIIANTMRERGLENYLREFWLDNKELFPPYVNDR